MKRALLTCGLIAFFSLLPDRIFAQGSAPLLDVPLTGCYDASVYGFGMFGTGSGSVTIPEQPGPIHRVYVEWVGAEDTTPGGLQLDGTSELLINDVVVTGILAEPLVYGAGGQLLGNAGYDPRAHTSAGPRGWFAWHAEIGPDGLYGIVPASPGDPVTLDISGWTSPSQQTNGATVTVIHSTGDCAVENELRFLTGVNWYHYSTDEHEFSELLIYPVEASSRPQVVRVYFSHAGTDKSQAQCRGGAVWMTADSGNQPIPVDPTAFDLVAIGDRDGDGIARGYGINGGVEILNDPFTSAALPCVPDTKPAPDEPYALGHPYPAGIADAPFRVISITPAGGGDVGEPGEWGVLEARILVPAGARWVAFQLESEADQKGESGSWVGGGVFLVEPTGTLGDRAWEDRNGNGRQDPGEPGLAGVEVQLLDGAGAEIARTITSGAGLYEFTNLPPARYRMRFTPPVGFTATRANVESGPNGDDGDSDIDPVTGETAATDLAPREADLSWDAGFYRPAVLGDFVWLDENGDGLQNDGPTGINGLRVDLHGAGADGIMETADDVHRSAVTGQSAAGRGYYGFGDLMPGRYRLTFTPRAGYTFTSPGTGSDQLDSDADPEDGRTGEIELVSGEVNLSLDAGLQLPPPAVTIEKSPDLQKIGYGDEAGFIIAVTNPGPQRLVSVTVTDPQVPDCSADLGALDVDDTVTYTCRRPDVRADFVNVARVDAVDEFGQRADDEDDATIDVLPEIVVVKDAAPAVVPRLGGEVLFTVLVQNRVEEPLTITQLVDDIHGNLEGRGSCTLPQPLAVGGTYSCAFSVFVVPPGDEGETDTITAWATDDEGNEATAWDTATVLPRARGTGTSGIGDYVWYDENANGLQDPEENGVPGVLVYLFSADGVEVDKTKTDANGIYGFENLDADNYYLVFALPTNALPYTAFSPRADGADDRDSNINLTTVSGSPLNGRTEIFLLADDTVDLTRDAGLTVPTFVEGDEPTAVELARFAAAPVDGAIRLLWATTAEVETNGFHLYRSTSPRRDQAVRITTAMVPAQGSHGGTYGVDDTAVLPGIFYYYWLVEVENGVEAEEFGPVQGQMQRVAGVTMHEIYLPAVMNR